jgi:hypothetical protein
VLLLVGLGAYFSMEQMPSATPPEGPIPTLSVQGTVPGVPLRLKLDAQLRSHKP